jgi:hypothetical protein
MTLMTPTQGVMARYGLRLSVRAAAELAMVGVNTVTRFENGNTVEDLTVRRLQTAYERAGATFLPDDGHGEGVRIRRLASDSAE